MVSIDALVARGACNQIRVHIQLIVEMQCRHRDHCLFIEVQELFTAVLGLKRAGLKVDVTVEDLYGSRRSPQSSEKMQGAMRGRTMKLSLVSTRSNLGAQKKR
jgi:hypothetical protein